MARVLDRIIDATKARVAREKKLCPLPMMRDKVARLCADWPRRDFHQALLDRRAMPPAIIAEIKYASPSKGVIRPLHDPIGDGQRYADNGAACLSILTEKQWFKGDLSYLEKVRSRVDRPILRKDFMIDPWQIYQSRLAGADCILLILAALDIRQCSEWAAIATDIGLDVLVEVHTGSELDQALRLPIKMIGVNNRNLNTLDVDINVSHELIPNIRQAGFTAICESGISRAEDMVALADSGASAFLIGESLMRTDDPGAALATLCRDFGRLRAGRA